MNKKPYALNLDFFSIVVSLLCALHCILLPLVFSTLPLWGFEVLENSAIEWASIILTLGAGGEAIRKGYTRFHRSRSIVFVFLVGFALMTGANWTEGAATEMVLKGAGALLVIGAHLGNWQKSRSCRVYSCEDGRKEWMKF